MSKEPFAVSNTGHEFVSGNDRGYQTGYDDGLSEGERRGWEKGIKAAAAYHDKEAKWWREEAKGVGGTDKAIIVHGAAHEDDAAAIRELKKP